MYELIDRIRMLAQNGPAVAAMGTTVTVAIMAGLWHRFRRRTVLALQSAVSAEVQSLHTALEDLSAASTRRACREGFMRRRARAVENLWPRIVACDIAQRTIASQKRQGNVDLRDAAFELRKRRCELSDFVQSHSLYLHDDTRQLVRALDDRLADRNVDNVSTDVGALEQHLRARLDDPTQAP